MYTTANNRLTQLTQILLPIVNDADSSFAQYLLQNPTFAPNPESSLNPENHSKLLLLDQVIGVLPLLKLLLKML